MDVKRSVVFAFAGNLSFVRAVAGIATSRNAVAANPAPSATRSGQETVITSTGLKRGSVKYVWLIIPENKSYDETFSGLNKNSYLWKNLPDQGAFLKNYYGSGHFSMDNYISLVSEQAPEEDVQEDCDVRNTGIGTNRNIIAAKDDVNFGQMTSPANANQPSHANAPDGENGCTYPTDVPTLFNQFNAAGVSWKRSG